MNELLQGVYFGGAVVTFWWGAFVWLELYMREPWRRRAMRERVAWGVIALAGASILWPLAIMVGARDLLTGGPDEPAA